MPIKIDNIGTLSVAAGGATPVLGGTSGSVLFVDSSGNLAQDNAAFKYTAASDLLLIPNIDGSEAANGDLTLQGTSHATRTSSYVILQPNGGNVGIGTTGPTALLHLSKALANPTVFANADVGQLHISGTSASSGEFVKISFTNPYSDANVNAANAAIGAIFTGSGSSLYFGTSNAYEGLTNSAMVISPTGLVGIGTTAPEKALEVNSATGANLRLTYNDSNGSALYYADFEVSSAGVLNIISSGSNGTRINLANATTAHIKIGTVSEYGLFLGGGANSTSGSGFAGNFQYNITTPASSITASGNTTADGIYFDNGIHFLSNSGISGAFTPAERLTILPTGVGVFTTAPDAALEINSATGNNLRLTYNDSNGSATTYTDFATISTGGLLITPSGRGMVGFGGDVTLTTSGTYFPMILGGETATAINITNSTVTQVGAVGGLNVDIRPGGTAQFNNVRGINSSVLNNNTSANSMFRAIYGTARLNAAGARANTLIGADFNADTDAATGGTVAKMSALDLGLLVREAGVTATNAYGLKILDLTNAGTIGSTYGIYIGDLTSGTQTNQAYSIYVSDTAARNLISGATLFTETVTHTGSMIVKSVTDAGPMTATNGTVGEIVFNTSNSKFYGCSVTGTPATWVAFN